MMHFPETVMVYDMNVGRCVESNGTSIKFKVLGQPMTFARELLH